MRGAAARHLFQVAALWLALACGDEHEEGELHSFEGSDLPVVVVDTGGHRIVDEPRIGAELRLFTAPVSGLLGMLEGPASLSTAVGIEVRGYTSLEFSKKQYGLEGMQCVGGRCRHRPARIARRKMTGRCEPRSWTNR